MDDSDAAAALSTDAGRALRVNGFGPHQVRDELLPFSYQIDALADGDVLVSVSHCGVCFSDVDCIDNVFGYHSFPFIPGHEVIGTVAAIGAAVKGLTVGQRVGIGPNVRSCMACETCDAGLEQMCPTGQLTLMPGLNGGFADHIVAGAEWVFPVPDGLSDAEAAPLMCAGVTTFAPLRRHITPMMRVGIVGIGGLGHLALQFASKMGAEVTALAANVDPESVALFEKLGATNVIDISDPEQMKAAYTSFDFILSTIYGENASVKGFVRLLRPNGKLCVVGAAMQPLDMPAAHLVLAQTSIVGSAAGGRQDVADMLTFATRHDIKPMVEVVPLDEVNTAISRIRSGSARFRMVLDIAGAGGATKAAV